MSTRAAFTFIDDHGEHHVYKHHDGYPEGAARALAKAVSLAWDPPRFEANEFGAAFVAANKKRSGDIRLASCWRDHLDLEYRYEVFQEEEALRVRALAVSCSYPENLWKSEEIFRGSLRGFIREQAPEATQQGEAVNKTAASEETGHLFEVLSEAA